uniref:Uncharacterized protein n=1 Tax=Mastacembelus armatus TaxID=205130 RepID=A0A3Q3MM84_9TELE
MKLTVTAVLCLSFLLIHTHFSLARKNIKIGEKLNFFKKDPKIKSHVDSKSKGKQLNQGGYPQQPHRPGGYPNQGGYYQQPGYTAGGYLPQGYPNRGGYGGYGSYGGYPGGYVNHNPNNKILSPHYGGSFGYGGYGVYGGSPFSHSVSAMGRGPTDVSRGFGHSAVLAAAGGAMAGMALGYGLGRFPRPHFQFHNPQEEYYYNHYMYRRYGMKSSDTNDYSRDYRYTQPPETYDRYMDSCMKRTDLLPAETRKQNNKPAATTTIPSTTTTAVPNATEANSTTKGNSTVIAPLTPNESEANPVPPVSQGVRKATEDDDTVSIVEIGYPALIKQLKARRCVELYLAYSNKYLKKQTGGAQELEMGLQGLLAVVSSTIVILLNNNMLMLLH